MIDVKNLAIEFDAQTIIENLHFTIPTGKLGVIVGQSGKGKSTILKALLGFVPNFRGKITVNSIPLNQQTVSRIRKFTAWLPQQTEIYYQTAREMFFAPFELKANKHKRPTESQIKQIFEKLNLDFSILDKPINQISGGQKQRLAIASIILLDKQVILLDEPTSALDSENSKNVVNLIGSLQDKTILVATHTSDWQQVADVLINLDMN